MAIGETSAGSGVTIHGAGAEQRLFGRYTLKRVLGRGGMGIVWLAHDDELKRSVAMKFLPDMIVRDREAVEDLKRETRRSLDLTHHHIVRIYDFTQDDNSAAIIMEYVDGETLSAMKTQQPGACFSISTLTVWAGHFCQALDYAHRQARVVHRDLKPANLMVNSRGDLKITDFGISRSMSDSMTRVSMSNTAGTLAYMSPEQALGSPPAAADDIYAFGATIYDLLTGRPPFFRGNLQVQLETVTPPPMHARRAELGNSGEPIPALWEEVIAACLVKRPQDRPQSMGEIASLLGIGGPTTGYRPSTNPTFAPLTGLIVPSTTRATQEGQPPTSPTLQRTLSSEELITQVQGAPGSAGSSPPKTTPASKQPIKATSMGDIVPGFDLVKEPTAQPIAPPPPAPEAPAPAADEVPPEAADDSFPTMVAQPPAIPAESAEEMPVEVEPVASVEQPDALASPNEYNAPQTEVAEEELQTLQDQSLEQAVESDAADLQEPPSQEFNVAEPTVSGEPDQSLDSVTLAGYTISPPQETFEDEFPTFAGTPAPEIERMPAAEVQSTPAVPPLPPAPSAAELDPPPAFAPHVFSPPAPPTFSPPPGSYGTPRKSRAALFVGLTLAALVIGGAIWMGMRPEPAPIQTELAKPFIEQGRKYLASGQIEAAENQARLAQEKNPGDPDATQLQQAIETKKQGDRAVANERALAEQRSAEEKRLAEQKSSTDQENAEREADKLVKEGESLLTSDLTDARIKAEQALEKVPSHQAAATLLARVKLQQAKESTYTQKIAEANAALERSDFDAADRAVNNIPSEFASRSDVLSIRQEISQKRAAVAKPDPPTPPPRKVAEKVVEEPIKKPEKAKKPAGRSSRPSREDDDNDGPSRPYRPPVVDRPSQQPSQPAATPSRVIVGPAERKGPPPSTQTPFKGGPPGG